MEYMQYTVVIVNAIILTATVILCSIVLPLLIRDTKTKKVTKNFLVSLCISDLVRVVVGCGFLIRVGFGLKVTDLSCLFDVALFGASQIASSLVVVVTSLDRYLSLAYPIKYQATMNEMISYIVIGVNWTFVLLIGSLFIVFEKPSTELTEKLQLTLDTNACLSLNYVVKPEFLISVSLGLILPSIIVVIATNIRIYFIMKQVHSTSSKRTSFMFWVKSHFVNVDAHENTKSSRCTHREIRATLIISLTVTNFVAVWAPVIGFHIADLCGYPFSENFLYTTFTFLQIYSVINPFFYVFTIKHLKKEFKKLLGRVFCCNSEGNASKGNLADIELTDKETTAMRQSLNMIE